MESLQSFIDTISGILLSASDHLCDVLLELRLVGGLIAKERVDGAGPPFCFASAGEDAVCFQTFCNPVHRVALQVFTVDALYHLRLLWIDDEITICILGVAEEVIVIYLYLAILVAKLESQLHILAEGL